MAPCSNNISSINHLRLREKDNLRLRKPIVEKMRRDRINSCIEQLKLILEKEFQKQDPNTKLEKADILEMTVSYLKQQLQSAAGLSQRDYSQGYSQCWRESLHFLSVSSKTAGSTAVPLQQLQQLPQAQRASSPQLLSTSPVSPSLKPTTLQDTKGPVWRPW
ncbi:transcription factor HES-5-like [Osmerus mordax]|uniref:transcription factor HES-5-like n=1 Tax=Osmerus mordax TaxID=8014 RepID=UPI003510C14F